MMKVFIYCLLSLVVMSEAKNLTSITWVHAVNNQSYLDSVLQDTNKVDMIEADVVLGHLEGETEIIPVMGHPPVLESDLSLESFLSQIDTFNQQENVTVKGVKLDFKSIGAFNQSVIFVQKYDNVSYPIWINADILPGPVLALTIPVNADQFLEKAKNFPSKTVLSLGWTTNWGKGGIPPNLEYGFYDQFQIDKMIDEIEEHQVTHEITFPVRAGIVANSLGLMEVLLDKIPNSTLTIWSSVGDFVDVELLRKLIAVIGIERIYVDVPEELMSQLHLDDLPDV